MNTAKNETTKLQQGVNAEMASLGNPMRQLQSVMKRRASEATKPPAVLLAEVPPLRQKIAEYLATHHPPTPKPPAPADTPFMRSLKFWSEGLAKIQADQQRRIKENSQPAVATPQAVLDQRCLVTPQPVPVPPAAEPRIIAVPVMVPRGRR